MHLTEEPHKWYPERYSWMEENPSTDVDGMRLVAGKEINEALLSPSYVI